MREKLVICLLFAVCGFILIFVLVKHVLVVWDVFHCCLHEKDRLIFSEMIPASSSDCSDRLRRSPKLTQSLCPSRIVQTSCHQMLLDGTLGWDKCADLNTKARELLASPGKIGRRGPLCKVTSSEGRAGFSRVIALRASSSLGGGLFRTLSLGMEKFGGTEALNEWSRTLSSGASERGNRFEI